MPIAFDAVTGTIQSADAAQSLTFAFTCTGDNRQLTVCFRFNSDDDVATGVTYAGVAMTQRLNVSDGAGTHGRSHIYTLDNPASGSNNVVISCSTNQSIRAGAISFTSSSAFDASNSSVVTSTTHSVTVTTVAADAWIIGFLNKTTNAAFTEDGNTTMRMDIDASGFYIFTRGPVTPAGAFALGGTVASAEYGTTCGVSISPIGSPPAVTGALISMLMNGG